MPYDPRMMQMAQMGIGMMGPQGPQSSQQQQPQRPKQWWEQAVQYGQPANRAVNTPDSQDPNDPDARKKVQPSLLQMLMLGGKPTYSGTPQPGPQQGNPWGMLGSMGMPGGGGGR